MSIEEERKRASSETPLSADREPSLVGDLEVRDHRIRFLIAFMRSNMQKKVSLIDLGRQVNLSPAHVSRLFSTEIGLSPSEYLIRLRIDNARRLLTNTMLSIKEIMALCGYNNRGHFVEHFKRYFSKAPSEYRKNG